MSFLTRWFGALEWSRPIEIRPAWLLAAVNRSRSSAPNCWELESAVISFRGTSPEGDGYCNESSYPFIVEKNFLFSNSFSVTRLSKHRRRNNNVLLSDASARWFSSSRFLALSAFSLVHSEGLALKWWPHLPHAKEEKLWKLKENERSKGSSSK